MREPTVRMLVTEVLGELGHSSRPDLKVLFITGYAENAAVGNDHLGPGMAVMTTPFAMESLASRIKEMIVRPA